MRNIWRFEFDADGGYDCTSAAYRIFRNDVPILAVDVRDHLPVDVKSKYDSDEYYRALHSPNADAESLAAALVSCGNMGRLP